MERLLLRIEKDMLVEAGIKTKDISKQRKKDTNQQESCTENRENVMT